MISRRSSLYEPAMSGRVGGLALLGALFLLSSACTGLAPHRTEASPCSFDDDPRICATHSLEVRDEYLLGFVELDDQGWLWDRRQLRLLEDRLSEEIQESDLIMLVFVHGWKHSAGVCGHERHLSAPSPEGAAPPRGG